ncbi:LysR family transcriptional regulator [Rhizobium sp. SSA_523]|uniref:LysR family transcriptional regulator n=1 Tax=Rhizobium sp. SSA_523 TaxID=2952477 RepID=UPI0020902172|nr:LysR family transcriptional regulator [Rhizobium sp. SSA_523]MCO5734842.1 LysR family transcriptional regulator [Rhizobium sp. SSA_523]WKC21822.1 LysR substrate-binding domain-containing protein [Rhizobium sp. SSA_523]
MNLITSMRYFVRVYEMGSFSGAAKLLDVGQSAVSKVVAQLEKELGVPLLVRSTRQLTPTEQGRVFYEHATKVLEDVEAAVASVGSMSQSFSGQIRIGGTLTFMSQYIIPKLPLFLNEHPAIDISVHLDDRNVGLIEQGIDLALRMGQLDDSGYVAKRIGRCRRIVVGTPAYLAKHAAPHKPEDLTDHSMVVFSQGEGGERFTFKGLRGSKSISVRPRLRINAMEGIRSAVLAGAGLSVATEWMFEAELESGAVLKVLDNWVLPDLDLWAVMPGGRRISPKIRAFVDFIEVQSSPILQLGISASWTPFRPGRKPSVTSMSAWIRSSTASASPSDSDTQLSIAVIRDVRTRVVRVKPRVPGGRTE